jgi:ELWxxDGT repeat protein
MGLWSFDANATQPQLVKKHINPAYEDFALVIGSNSFYYVANDSINGLEPWVSDGTTAGTKMIKDINPGINRSCDEGGSSSNTFMILKNNKMFFNPLINNADEQEIWETDGTNAGTKLSIDVSGSISSYPQQMTLVGDNFFFTARTTGSNNSRVMHSSDGTLQSGVPLMDKNSSTLISFNVAIPLNNKAFIVATPSGKQDIGMEPFISDGTPAGTQMLADINPKPYAEGIVLQSGAFPIAIGNTIFFIADDGVHGAELWKYTDNSNPTGIKKISQINNYHIYPNPATNELNISSNASIEKAEIYNLTGQLLLTSNQPKVDISELNEAIYFIRIYSKNEIATYKFIKQ